MSAPVVGYVDRAEAAYRAVFASDLRARYQRAAARAVYMEWCARAVEAEVEAQYRDTIGDIYGAGQARRVEAAARAAAAGCGKGEADLLDTMGRLWQEYREGC